MWELTKSFRFEAAHALSGTTWGAASEEIHGHSFRAEVSVRGTPNPETGMVLDLGLLGGWGGLARRGLGRRGRRGGSGLRSGGRRRSGSGARRSRRRYEHRGRLRYQRPLHRHRSQLPRRSRGRRPVGRRLAVGRRRRRRDNDAGCRAASAAAAGRDQRDGEQDPGGCTFDVLQGCGSTGAGGL